MLTGLFIVILGCLIVLYPQLLSFFVGGMLVLFGLGMMAAAYQFRRIRKRSQSPFINWIIRW